MTALIKPEDFILATAVIDGETSVTRYFRQPFRCEPDFGLTSVSYRLDESLAYGEEPA